MTLLRILAICGTGGAALAAVMALGSRRPPPPIPPWKAALVNNTVIRLRSRRGGEPSQRPEASVFQVPTKPMLPENAASIPATEPPDTAFAPAPAPDPAVGPAAEPATLDEPDQPARPLDFTGPLHLRPEPAPKPEEPSAPPPQAPSEPAPQSPPALPSDPAAEPPSPADESQVNPEPHDPPPIPTDADSAAAPPIAPTPDPAPAATVSPSAARAVVARLEIPSDAESLLDIVQRSRASLNEIEGGYSAVLVIATRDAGGKWIEETVRVQAHVASNQVLMEWLDSPRSGRRLSFAEHAEADPVRVHLGPDEPRLLGERILVQRDHALVRGLGQIPIVELTLAAWIASLERLLAGGERDSLSFEGTKAPQAALTRLTDRDAARPHYHLRQSAADAPDSAVATGREWYIDTERMLPARLVLFDLKGEPFAIYSFTDIVFDRQLAADALRLD